MSYDASYSEFFELPANWSRGQWGENADGDRQLINDADPFKWSGEGQPPKLGASVTVYLNGMGTGRVLKYFAEHGWLGVLVQLDRNPAWRKSQMDGNPPAHIFGRELEPRQLVQS